MSKLLKTKEIAEIFSVHPTTINRWRKEAKPVPFILLGRQVRFELEKVIQWLEYKKEGNNG